MGPYESDVSGTYQVSYTPTMIGTYSFYFTFPGQTVNGTGYGTYFANFLASTSKTVTVTVQQAPIQGYVEAPVPLPGQYWSIPINGQNRAWNVISGPWLQGNNFCNASGPFNAYTYAPGSAHILWGETTLPCAFGLAGGDYGSMEFSVGSGGSPTVAGTPACVCIMGGYLYYNSAPNVVAFNNNGTTLSTFSCMNVQTGQIMWTVPGSITTGQILEWRSQQERATIPYLWSIAAGSYKLYAATNGQLLNQWVGTNVLSGTVVLEPPETTVIGENIGGAGGGGALVVFHVGQNAGQKNGWLIEWNSTLALGMYQLVNLSNIYGTGYNYLGENPQTWTLPPVTTALNWSLGIQCNITVTTPLPSPTATWTIFGADLNYVCLSTLASTTTVVPSTGESYLTLAAYNVQTQSQAWVDNIQVPAYLQGSAVTSYIENGGNIIITDQDTEQIMDYSESTGTLLWSATPFMNDFVMERIYYGVVAYGMLYNEGFDGYMHAINITNGVQ